MKKSSLLWYKMQKSYCLRAYLHTRLWLAVIVYDAITLDCLILFESDFPNFSSQNICFILWCSSLFFNVFKFVGYLHQDKNTSPHALCVAVWQSFLQTGPWLLETGIKESSIKKNTKKNKTWPSQLPLKGSSVSFWRAPKHKLFCMPTSSSRMLLKIKPGTFVRS